MNDLIFASLETWDHVWRRNQFVCDELARRHPEAQILFVEPSVDVSAAVRRRRPDELRGAGTRRPTDRPNVTATRGRKWLPNHVSMLRRLNQGARRRHLLRQMRRLRIGRRGRPLLWINDHSAVHLVGRLGEAAVIYDITDDWTQFGDDTPYRRRVVEQDRVMCEKADAIIVCSEALWTSKQAYRHKLHLIKNGVDAAHYRQVLEPDEASSAAAATAQWARPVLGYTGTVHRDRLDVALVTDLARRMEAGTIVFVGPNHLSPAERQQLTDTGRVRFVGPVPYAELPRRMRAFDVCVVPHRVTSFTESLNPIKLWEYLAAGKPIVSTPVAGFRDHPEHVRLATDADSFAAAVADALRENGHAAAARRAVVAEHSWERRVDQIENVLQQLRQQR